MIGGNTRIVEHDIIVMRRAQMHRRLRQVDRLEVLVGVVDYQGAERHDRVLRPTFRARLRWARGECSPDDRRTPRTRRGRRRRVPELSARAVNVRPPGKAAGRMPKMIARNDPGPPRTVCPGRFRVGTAPHPNAVRVGVTVAVTVSRSVGVNAGASAIVGESVGMDTGPDGSVCGVIPKPEPP